MSPVGLSVSGSTYVLATGQAKLWAVLIGVNQYQDQTLPSLHYSAKDCQGLGDALLDATQEFPRKQVLMHHDFADRIPTLTTVRDSLQYVIDNAKPLDTVLFYFSGHGVLEPISQQVVLGLSDTRRDALLETGLPLQELLGAIDRCMARQQLIWLDACHSGNLTIRGQQESGFSPTNQLVQVLQSYAAQSRHFYALLSCDAGQQAWEFPDLEHGLFTYYLMRGLRGEAVNSEGEIEADGLYKYIYYQTKQYIQQTNQQLRLLNHQKQQRHETQFYPEYPRQTPKRIVVGTGEIILGLKPDRAGSPHPSQAVSIAELGGKVIEPSLDRSQPDHEEQALVPTQATGEATVVGAQPFLEINNQGQVLRLPLEQKLHRLGRDSKWSDLQVPKREWDILSRRQAVLQKEGDGYRIYDGDGNTPSRNGIFHDRTRINAQTGYLLTNGTTLEIGQDPRNQVLLTYHHPISHQPFVLPSKRRLGLRNLKQFPVVLGRGLQSSYASMQLDSPVVSRRHATIQRQANGTYTLENHGTNGTFVNGQQIKRSVTLQSDDRIQIGPFTLLFRDEVLELADRGDQIRLDAQRLKRQVGDKLILDEISLAIEPGQLVALVGGSGAGKSTLMKTLLGIEPTTSGAVFLNGNDLQQHFDIYRTHIGYVPQDDIVHSNLTVEEVLTYACKLRLPPDTNVSEVVKRTLSQMMLSHVKSSYVQDLSGGQRKRVSIGVELLADPKLFFLDEPTSGLDPGLDKEMMKLLRELADQGRTVILVTHATANIEECDRVAFLGRGGKLCYFGPPRDALNFFEMPAEDLKYFADIYRKLDPGTTKQDTESAVLHWQTEFRRSAEYQTYVQAPLSEGTTSSTRTQVKKSGVSPWRQLTILCQRQWQLVGRDRVSLGLALLTGPIGIGLILLGVQGKTPFASLDSPDATQASLALRVLFIFSCIAIWVGLSSSVQDLIKEVSIYARERLINLGLFAYVGSKFLIRAGLAVLQTLLIAITVLIGFASPDSTLLPWAIGLSITTFLTLLSSVSLGLMLSAFVKNENEANSALPLIMIPQIIFSGVLFELEGLASKISWLMPSRWSVGAFGTLVNVNGLVPKLPTPPGQPAPPQPFDPSPVYEATWQNLSLNWSILCLHTLVYLLVTLYLQKRKDVH